VLPQNGKSTLAGPQFTSFSGFTSFTGTKVQILTLAGLQFKNPRWQVSVY
jgi:hypothetical protein